MTNCLLILLFYFLDLITSRLAKSDGTYGYSSTQGPSSRRMLIPKSQESPRLFLKFHRETGDEVSDRQKDVTSYSVIMGMSDKHSLSPVDSNVSSVDSDLYDPQLESKSNKVNPMKDTVSDISSTNVLSNKNNVTMAVINPDLELQNFERFNTLEPDSHGIEPSQDFFMPDMRKQETQPSFSTQESSEVKNNSDFRDYIPNVVDSSHARLKDDKLNSQNTSNHKTVSSSTSLCHSVTNNSISSINTMVPCSTERTNASGNSQNFSSFPRRNSISCNVVSTNDGSRNGTNVDNGSESTVTTSGLKWDLRSASSPRVEEESNLSAKSESDRVSSPIRLDKDLQNSPRSDKEKDSRSCSPKVPPLKIIIPQKNSSSSSSDSESLKIHVSKAALPYVLNQGDTNPVTTVATAGTPVASLLAQESLRPLSPASSRPSSRGSNTPSLTKEVDKVLKQVEDNLTEDSLGKPPQELSDQDVSKSKEDEKKEDANQKSTRTLRSHTKEQQKMQEKPKEKDKVEKEKEKEKQSKYELI